MEEHNLLEKKIVSHIKTKKKYKIIKINNDIVLYQDLIDNSIIKKETINWFLLNMTEPYIP